MAEPFPPQKRPAYRRPALDSGWPLDVQRFLLFLWMLLRVGLPLLFRKAVGKNVDAEAVGISLRQALQELGITYVKLGQFMAMRFDILPSEICRQLAQLFDDVPPLPEDVIRGVLAAEFSKPVEQVFEEFEWTCIAAASVAQVHKAVLPGGEIVAVKVQRPGIERVFAADIRNFRRAARVGDRLALLGPQSLVEALDEFERFTRREMDFTSEARTAERLRRNAGPFEDAPRVHKDLTTTRVLTMEFVEGLTLSNIIHMIEGGREEELSELAPNLDLEQAVQNFARACMRQLFVTGFFHADPHPGNIIMREDGTVVFIDFGIFGHLTAERRETFATYIENVALGNINLAYRHFVKLLQPTTRTDFQQLRRDVEGIMRRWHEASRNVGSPLAERHLGTYFGEFITAIRRNSVRMSLETLLFWRALLALDSTALRFAGQFDLLRELRDFFERTRPSPAERLTALLADRNLAGQFRTLAAQLPAQAALVFSDLSGGHFDARVSRASSPARSRQRDGRAQLLALTIVGSSLLAVSFAAPLGGAGQVVRWTVILFLLAAALAGRALR